MNHNHSHRRELWTKSPFGGISAKRYERSSISTEGFYSTIASGCERPLGRHAGASGPDAKLALRAMRALRAPVRLLPHQIKPKPHPRLDAMVPSVSKCRLVPWRASSLER